MDDVLTAPLAYARAQQLECAAWIEEHGYTGGAAIWLNDWVMEEFLIEQERGADE